MRKRPIIIIDINCGQKKHVRHYVNFLEKNAETNRNNLKYKALNCKEMFLMRNLLICKIMIGDKVMMAKIQKRSFGSKTIIEIIPTSN